MWFLFMRELSISLSLEYIPYYFEILASVTFFFRLSLSVSIKSVHKKLDLCWAHLQTNQSDIHQNTQATITILFLFDLPRLFTVTNNEFHYASGFYLPKMTILMKKSCFSTLSCTQKASGRECRRAPLSCRSARVSSHFSIKMIKWTVTTY